MSRMGSARSMSWSDIPARATVSAIGWPAREGTHQITRRDHANRQYLPLVHNDKPMDVRSLHQHSGLFDAHLSIGGEYRCVHQMANAEARPAAPEMFRGTSAHDVRFGYDADQQAVGIDDGHATDLVLFEHAHAHIDWRRLTDHDRAGGHQLLNSDERLISGSGSHAATSFRESGASIPRMAPVTSMSSSYAARMRPRLLSTIAPPRFPTAFK